MQNRDPKPKVIHEPRLTALYGQRRAMEERLSEVQGQLDRADAEEDISPITFLNLSEERDKLEAQVDGIEAEILSLEPRRPPQ